AERVVDLLEAVQVHEDNPQAGATGESQRARLLEPVEKALSIRQLGQRIVKRLVHELRLGLLAGADVLEHRGDVSRATGAVTHERHHGPTPHQRTVVPAEAVLEVATVAGTCGELAEQLDGG